jgi:hypothetical protein
LYGQGKGRRAANNTMESAMSITTGHAKWLQDLANDWNDRRHAVMVMTADKRVTVIGSVQQVAFAEAIARLAEAERELSAAIMEIGR